MVLFVDHGIGQAPPPILVNHRDSITYSSSFFGFFVADAVLHSPPNTPADYLGSELLALSSCPSSILIHVHGFQNSLQDAQNNLDDLHASASAAGFTGQVVGFAWNSNPGFPHFDAAEAAADLMAGELNIFISHLWQRWPNMPIYLTSHSLGARVVLGAIQALYDPGNPPPWAALQCIQGAALIAAAVDNEVLEPGEDFGPVGGETPPVGGGGSTPPIGLPPIDVWYNMFDQTLKGYVFEERNIPLGQFGPETPEVLPSRVHILPTWHKIQKSGEDRYSHSSYLTSRFLVECVVARFGVL